MKYKFLSLLLLLPMMAYAQSFTPPEISGWTQDGEVETFDRSNLFSHINGAAEFYYSYGFEKLYVVRYAKGDAEMAVEAYHHGDPVHAYGIYSMERPPEIAVNNIGAEGYYEEEILNFFTGPWYVKMRAYREPEAGSGVLLTTARQLAPRLCGEPQLPRVVRAMPAEGLVSNSRQYVSNTFMGLELLGSAYRAAYKEGDSEIELFVIERETPQAIEKLIKEYQAFAQSEKGESPNGYRIEDPFNGTIYLKQVNNYLIGFSGAELPELRSRLQKAVEEALLEI